MKQAPNMGYIVNRFHDHNTGALELCACRGVRGGVLLWGDCATVFPTRSQANAAICRTVGYFTRLAREGAAEAVENSAYAIQRLRAPVAFR